MNTNILPIALLAFFVLLFICKAASESAADHAAMKNYTEDIKTHPYRHDYVPIPQSEVNEFYKTTTVLNPKNP